MKITEKVLKERERLVIFPRAQPPCIQKLAGDRVYLK